MDAHRMDEQTIMPYVFYILARVRKVNTQSQAIADAEQPKAVPVLHCTLKHVIKCKYNIAATKNKTQYANKGIHYPLE